MKKVVLIVLLIIVGCLSTYGQNNKLYTPLTIQAAYEKGTRSIDGHPGNNYWVNSSDYKITINFDPITRKLNGSETIQYKNNSADSLNMIVFRLFENIYKKGNSRDWSIRPDAIGDGVCITKLVVNDLDLTSKIGTKDVTIYGTNLFVNLNAKISPKSIAAITVEWNYVIPAKSPLRMGQYDSTSYFIGYFYPQVSVYDDIDGWDTFNYDGIQEFYNDICNFEVTVNVPKNFVVWGTGLLNNAEEVLSENIYQKFLKAKKSEDVIGIITEDYLKNGNITSDNKINSWRFKADQVPDFAFALSDHYLWDGVKYYSDKDVFVSAAYKKENEGFKKVADLSKKSIAFFSTELPGVPFPYPSMTVFDGSGGMEYPMMVNEGVEASNWNGNVYVTSHEILHTYFPFYMGINERKYAWMDEGWAVMLPMDFQKSQTEGYDPEARNIKGYEKLAGVEHEVPLMTLTSNLKSAAYRQHAYGRSAVAYLMLENLIGEESFKTCLKEYIDRWNGKHPMPYDFFYTFEDVLKKDLSWFWKSWFFEPGYPDLGIKSAEYVNNELVVRIEKIGNLPTPLELTLKSDSGFEITKYEPLSIWKDGKTVYEIKLQTVEPITQLSLGSEHIPDANYSNNNYEIKK